MKICRPDAISTSYHARLLFIPCAHIHWMVVIFSSVISFLVRLNVATRLILPPRHHLKHTRSVPSQHLHQSTPKFSFHVDEAVLRSISPGKDMQKWSSWGIAPDTHSLKRQRVTSFVRTYKSRVMYHVYRSSGGLQSSRNKLYEGVVLWNVPHGVEIVYGRPSYLLLRIFRGLSYVSCAQARVVLGATPPTA